MIYLLLSIVSSTLIFVVFKSFKKYDVNTLQAIVVNYFTACFCGLLQYGKPLVYSEIITSSWFFGALGLGFLFITIFNIMALTAQKNGLSVASVASKMSVIIPVIFGVYVYKESVDTYKIVGIVLALIAVYFTSLKQKEANAIVAHSKSLVLPILLFLGSGVIDTFINYFAPDDDIPLFSATIFLFAGCIGVCVLSYASLKKQSYFKLKSVPFGVLLGIVNYGSIYFLLKALRVDDFESSSLFTINNVVIVILSTLVGLVIFKDKIAIKNWIGILVALISIVLVSL